MSMKMTTTNRGFVVFGSFVDSYGTRAAVVESSRAGRPCVWVQNQPTEKSQLSSYDALHLTVKEAKKLRKLLKRFIQSAEDPENWRNSDEYKEAWG